MDLNIVNNEEKFLAGKLEGYTLKGAENKFDDKGNPLLFPGLEIIKDFLCHQIYFQHLLKYNLQVYLLKTFPHY